MLTVTLIITKHILGTIEVETYFETDVDMCDLECINSRVVYDSSPTGNSQSSRLQVDFGVDLVSVDYKYLMKLKESFNNDKVFFLQLSNGKFITRWSASDLYEQLTKLIAERKISLTNFNRDIESKIEKVNQMLA